VRRPTRRGRKNVELLLIENVGNLLCPAAYDLGEAAKVALLSVPEGDNKPLKYPGLFQRGDLMVLTKIDLLGTSDFDPDRAEENAREVAPHIEVLRLSCKTGEGVEGWTEWLETQLARTAPFAARPA
jgi:hydrogenase nickel incorporation protein HypB